jgi:hypothetical protein
VRQYFTSKIGQTIGRTVTSGNTRHGSTFARLYRAEVLNVTGEPDAVTSGLVLVNLTSEDIHPSGSLAGGTHRNRGDILVNLDQVDGLETFWQHLLTEGDPAYGGKHFRKAYPQAPTR